MEIRKAIPTEYKGVRFDSKAEAVFARALDLAGHDWVYHPTPHCGHEWDFLVFPATLTHFKQYMYVGGELYQAKTWRSEVLCKPMLIEYKPAAPTATYIENLTEKMRENPVESILVWGNPWDVQKNEVSNSCYVAYPIFSSLAKYGWGDFIQGGDNGELYPCSYRHNIEEMLGLTLEIAQEAKAYRYDLSSRQSTLRSVAPKDIRKSDQPIDLTDFFERLVEGAKPKLIAARETESRTKRLQKVVDYLNSQWPALVLQIAELEDDKGFLTCRWRTRVSLHFKALVATAWATAGCEIADNVRHEVMY